MSLAEFELPPRYSLRTVLGEGDLGAVLRVHDTKLALDVAMKVLDSQLADSLEHIDLFRREAMLTAALRHPAIIPVHDLGTLPDGRPWFTMELMEGHHTLAQAVASLAAEADPASVQAGQRELVQTLHDVATALSFAHDSGVVHCSVDSNTVQIGAFGEARLVHWAEAWMLAECVGMPDAPTLADQRRQDVVALGVCLQAVVAVAEPDHDLVTIADAALDAASPGGAQASAIVVRLAGWLDYQRQRDRALASFERSAGVAAEVRSASFRLAALRDQLEEVRERCDGWAGVVVRREIWDKEDAVAAAEADLQRLEIAQVQHLRASLSSGVSLPQVQRALGDVYRRRAEAAERSGSEHRLSTALAQLASVDDGAHLAWRQGQAWISLHTDPPGVQVFARRVDTEGWSWAPAGAERALGASPLRKVELSAGSWQLTMRRPGGHPVVLPIFLERLEHQQLTPPEAALPSPIWLPPSESISSEECYVPAGWFLAGGTLGVDPWPPMRLWADAFVMRRRLITAGEWCEFLADLRFRGAPIEEVATPDDLVVDRDGAFEPVGHAERPACGFNCLWAVKYAEWRAKRDGLPWRLPQGGEWEKAARGADGRLYPWGNRWDSSLAANLGSGADWADPLGGYARDRSVYGVESMAGHVHEYCGDKWLRDPPAPGSKVVIRPFSPAAEFLEARGGDVLVGPPVTVLTTRWANQPSRVFKMGIRLVRSV